MKTRLLSLVVALLTTTALWAQSFKYGGLKYELISSYSNDVRVTRDDYSKLTSVNIPSTVTYQGIDYRVTSIGNSAFSNCTGLTSITIPNSVTHIGSDAFSGCTNLTSITIPNSVTSIDEYTFYNCTGLTSITIPNSVTSIRFAAFAGCTNLTSVTIPNSVTSIEESIFSGCTNLTSITIPNSVTSIGEWAFSDCTSLTSVTIPNSVTSIGRYAFDGCYNVISMVVESGNIKYDSRDNCNAIIETESNTLISGCKTTIIPNNVTSIGEDAFSGCASLISITIPNSITNIGEDAFIGCTGLTSITIPNSVVYIGEWAFNGCTGLTSITIPNSVTSIDRGAFEDCTNLTTVTIGNNDHLNIWWIVFDGCESLESVTCYAETPPTITFFETTDEEGNPFKEGAFYADRLSEMKLYVPAKAIEQYKKAEEWKDFGQIIPIGATTIETDDDKPIVQPSLADVTITWKIVPNTDTYTIAITRGAEMVCTLVFDADGVLSNIALAALARNGEQRHAPAAVMTEKGYRFTIVGLEAGTQYGYSISAKDKNGKELQTYSGTFNTQEEGSAVENTFAGNACTQQKVFRDGQVLIQRGGKTYTLTGEEVE